MIKNTIANTDIQITQLGLGCAGLGNLYQAVSDECVQATLGQALSCGINYFDTAPYYGFGYSERRLGDVLRAQPNNQYVISTKVGRLLKPSKQDVSQNRHGFVSPMPFEPVYDYSYDGVMRSFEDSLQRLGLDKIDILLMHDIGQVTHQQQHAQMFKTAMQGGYKAMDELRSQGLVKAIGLGVNEYQVCEQAMDYGYFNCFLLAGRYTLLEQAALTSFLPKCLAHNSSIILGGPYNSGILASGTQTNAPLYYNYAPASQQIIDKVQQIEQVCQQFAIPLAAAAVQFPLFHPAVVNVIPGMSSAEQVKDTVTNFNLNIDPEFWLALKNQGLIAEDAPCQ